MLPLLDHSHIITKRKFKSLPEGGQGHTLYKTPPLSTFLTSPPIHPSIHKYLANLTRPEDRNPKK